MIDHLPVRDGRSLSGDEIDKYYKRYIINNSFEFDPGAATITPLGKFDKIPLSPLTSRLLAVFCSSPGEMISREAIMNEIWAKHGMTVSENTLTKAISKLRKETGGVDGLRGASRLLAGSGIYLLQMLCRLRKMP
ncbi:winged helix-turn-helix domain-containing protein [Burkholderia ubonensis]|uniref:winged helix-turn-helix domain-containing protein n=1 Tax=Burkholderia ubonensis TaxID=101571 RepID=UPI0009B43246|nr:winged helix-turn-helix domain-containing protein [Burkholderia ubonensis]